MGWNRKIYVATKSLGVYYTSNFSDPAVQPTWTAVNTGLSSLSCREFWLDPFEQEDKQYVLSNALYMRTGGGNWTAILTVAQCNTLTSTSGGSIQGFHADPSVAGRLWVTFKPGNAVRVLYSDNYGSSWTVAATPPGSPVYDVGTIRSYGDTVFVMYSYLGGAAISYSANKAVSWNRKIIDFTTESPITMNPYNPTLVFCATNMGGVGHTDRLSSVNTSGTLVDYFNSFNPTRLDQMWFDPDDVLHQRYVRAGHVWVTDDAWSTRSDMGATTPNPYSIAPQAGTDHDSIFIGLSLGTHVIGCLTGEADTTATGIAGANAGSAPYADSIPNTCGGLAEMGIQSIPTGNLIFTYDVLFEKNVNNDSSHPFGVAIEDAAEDDSVHVHNVALE